MPPILLRRQKVIFLEGCRSCGKGYTTNALKKAYGFITIYKDIGIPTIVDEFLLENLIFDRGYFSSYVYGLAWRNKYDKAFWATHIRNVEETYGDFLSKLHVVFISMTEENFKTIESSNRSKDVWDDTKDFRKQYDLYLEVLNLSRIPTSNIHCLPGFMKDNEIIDFFRPILGENK
jgi:hypothetical protein